jgi:RNA polymerase sigma-70 factor (TIGR02960 family)
VLERARAGDNDAFAELTGPHLHELRLHCYRMLGSLSDAEDALQETLLAAWRGLDGYAEQASVRTWLFRIATNRCLNVIRDGRRRRLLEPVAPFEVPAPTRRGDVTWLQPLPDAWLTASPDATPGPAARYEAREAVKLAFVTALQRLPPRQTAALVLCDVLGYSTAEAAAILDSTATAVKGALQRARGAMPAGPAAAANNRSTEELASRFAAAFTNGDVADVVALLSDGASLAMPPAPHEYVGHDAIAEFLAVSFRWRSERTSILLPVGANTQPAFACYLSEPGEPVAYPVGVFVLTICGDAIEAVTRFQDAALPQMFGMPAAIPVQ